MKREHVLKSALLLLVLLMSLSLSPPGFAGEKNSPSYRIGPSDLLFINVWKEPELTQEVTVMPDGKISIPLAGEIQAQGRTVAELGHEINEKLGQFVTDPQTTVIVRKTNSRVIYTLGKLNKPGPYPLQPNMTLIQALSVAGGFTEWADKKDILVVRREGNKEVRFHFNYKDYVAGKNIEQNVLLKPEDTIVVP